MTSGVRCMLMRGGTSKGLSFLADDLPAGPRERDALLLSLMGSGHPMQVGGPGAAGSLTSKVAVVSRPANVAADIDYLFLQLGVGEPNEMAAAAELLAELGVPARIATASADRLRDLIALPGWDR